jgi:hypothetical protein
MHGRQRRLATLCVAIRALQVSSEIFASPLVYSCSRGRLDAGEIAASCLRLMLVQARKVLAQKDATETRPSLSASPEGPYRALLIPATHSLPGNIV